MTRLSLPTLVLRYAGFALLAMAANLGTQRAVLAFGDPAQLLLPAIALGTLIGLAVKYALDKRWIFHDRGTTPLPRQFALYSLMGLATTALFWGTETAFWLLWHSDAARELGAALGLTVGYVVKYRLDRRFVFAVAMTGEDSNETPREGQEQAA